MDDKLLEVVVAAGVSLVVSVLGLWLGPRGQASVERLKNELEEKADDVRHVYQQRLEELKSVLADRNSATSARRDYEYDARKRLYEQVEPILFQLYESLEEAHYRVRSLARSSRSGNLGLGNESYIANDNYYLRSTAYKLILPVAYLRMIQRRITFVDLSLDTTFSLRYSLLKLYSRSFTDDFVFADLAPKLAYDPNNPNWKQLRRQQPAIYFRQALVVGDLEDIADSLVKQDQGTLRALQFGEFESILPQQRDDTSLQELLDLMQGFSPEEKPVLARMLVTQACLAQLILSTYDLKATSDLPSRLEAIVNSRQLQTTLAWRSGQVAELRPAHSYLAERLGWLGGEQFWIVRDRSNL
jgi:hypothetical protein